MSHNNESQHIRALDVLITSWTEDTLSVEDMTTQLSAVVDFVNNKTDFGEFLESSNLTGRERLN
jgi:hypothetical protein